MKNSKTKKLLSILLAVMMVVGMIPATAIPVSAATISGTTGTGTEADPIVVDTYSELREALKYTSSGESALYIKMSSDITCEDYNSLINVKAALVATGDKVLTINGNLISGSDVDTTIILSTDATLTVKGSGKIESASSCIDTIREDGSICAITIEGDITLEGNNSDGIVWKRSFSSVNIYGGTFINKASRKPFYGSVTLAGGSFPNGIDKSCDNYQLSEGCVYSYEDGTYSQKLLDKTCAVSVISSEYTLGFATQYPTMPEGKTSTHLGDFVVGDIDAAITFSFSANPLNDVLAKTGYTVQEELRVESSESGTIVKQYTGKNFTIDNRIARDYTIYETLRLIDANGKIEDEITHKFTLSIRPENYDVDEPLGSKYNPYIVKGNDAFKDAVLHSGLSEVYIKLGANITTSFNCKIDSTNVIIDLNGFNYDGKDTPWSVTEQGTLTLCGKGKFTVQTLAVSSTLIIKDDVWVDVIESFKGDFIENRNGTIIMHGGQINWYLFNPVYKENKVIVYGGKFRSGFIAPEGYVDIGVFNDEFELYGGNLGTTWGLDDFGYSYDNVTLNKLLATNGTGKFTVIDDFNELENYGDNEEQDVIVAAPGFIEQSPKMPEGETTTNLGKVQEESYPIYFNAVPLEKEFIDAGYSMVETLQIYNDEGKRVYSTSNNASNGKGIYYDLNNLPDDNYIIIEGVALKDKKGNTVLEKTNTFEIKWKQQILINEVNIEVANPYDQTAHIRGEVQTKGVNLDLAKWFLVNTDGTLTENGSKIFVPGNTYRYVVDLGLDKHYVFANGYTVKINGEDASRNEDGTWYKDFVARKKLKPIVEQDTYFFQSGTTREIRVDAHGDGVTYSWTGVSDGAGGYYTVSDYTERVQRLRIPEGAEGTNVYMVRITDAYGETVWKTITVHITSMGFKEIKPTPTAEEYEAGVTDYGYVFPGEDGSGVPKVYFEAYELSQGYIDEGYTMETSLIDYVDGVKVGEGYEAWEYTTSLPGAHEIVQKIVIKDAEGNVFKEYTYTHKMNVMRGIALNTAAYGTALYGYRVEVYQDGKLASEQTNGNDITMDVVTPVGDVKIVVSKNGYKAREYEATIPADGFFSLDTEILRWGDANLDDVLDVQDYQQTINKGLSDNHKLDGSYEQSLMDWGEDGYIDVIDCAYCVLCINGTDLFSASVEYDKYYGTGGETIKIPVTADGFGITYEWVAPEGAPAIVEGTEDEATVKISIEPGKYNIGDKFTYTCIVRDMFFCYAELEVEVEIESLNNLYAVTFSSQYEDITGLPGKTRIKAGDSITIPELIPQLEGYTFMYWYAGSDRLNPGDTYTPYQNTIIMPYMAKDYEITLYSGIEGELFGTHIGNYGHYYYLPEMDVLPEGYVFYGWTDVEGSNEVKYTTNYRYEIKGDVSFYPVIAKADEVTLEIYANDGTDRVIYSTTLAEQNGEIYFTIPEDLEMPTREGYVCTGFITSPDGYYYGVDKYWQGSKVAANPAGVVLYAHWELPNVLQFKGGMDGVIGLPDSVSFESPQSYQITSWLTPYCDGYEFLYWEDEEGNQYRPDDYVVVYGITTLTAVWEKIDTENYEIWISGQQLSKTNSVVQCGTGTARVVENEWGNVTLVLYDARITGTEGIRTEYNSLDIEVYGENTITVEGENARGITGPNGNIYITGPGSLDVNVEGDGAIGIKGLYSIDYATVNVNAEPETNDGTAYGVSCLSGGQYRITIDNGATLNTKGTYGIYRAGQLRIGKTSSVYAEGTEYGIYDVREIVDAWGGYSSGTVVAVGDIAAMYFDSSDGFPYHTLTNSEAYYGKNTAGLNLSVWDGDADFIDTPYATYGNKYIEIVPKACTGEHSFITYAGLEGNCEKDGLSDGEYCYNCGYVKTEREIIPATGHDYHTHNGKEPTCTEQGVKGTYTQCDNCGEYKGSVTFIDATGHSWGEWLFVEDYWYDEYGYGEKLYVRYCSECDEYQDTWYWYEDPNDTGSPNDWESGGAGPGKP